MKLTLAGKERGCASSHKPVLYGLKQVLPRPGWERLWLRLYSGLFTFWQTRRLRWALLILLVVVPVVKFAYLLLPESAQVVPGTWAWYLQEGFSHTYFATAYPDLKAFLFFTSELTAPTLMIFGLFLLFPRHYYPSYLLGIPFGHYGAMAVARLQAPDISIAVFNALPWWFSLLFIAGGVTLFILIDKYMFRSEDPQRAVEARIIGLVNLPGISWKQKEQLIRMEAARSLSRNNEIFERQKTD